MKQVIDIDNGNRICGICTLPMAKEYEDCNIAPYGQEPDYRVREIYPAFIIKQGFHDYGAYKRINAIDDAFIQAAGHSGIGMPLCPYCYDRLQDFIAEEKDKAIAWGKGIVPCSVGLDSTE